MTDEQLAVGWGIAWRTALTTSLVAVATALALRWFLDAPAPLVVIAAASGALMVGWRLPPARLVRSRQELRYRA